MDPMRPVHVLAAAGVAEMGVFAANKFNFASLLLGGLTLVAVYVALDRRATSGWTWTAAIAGTLAGVRLFTFQADAGITVALVALSASLYVAALALMAVQRRVPQLD